MDNNQLIDEIIARIKEKLEEKNENITYKLEGKPKLLLLAGSQFKFEHKVFEAPIFKECYQTEIAAEKNFVVNLQDYEAIILGELDNGEICRLAEGIGGCKYINLVMEAILKGKKIYLPKEYVGLYKYMNTAPKNFYGMIEKKLDFLIETGITVCEINQLKKLIFEGVSNPNLPEVKKQESVEPIAGKEVVFSKKVITEKNVVEAKRNGASAIIIESKSILTDLAKEYLRINKMEVLRK